MVLREGFTKWVSFNQKSTVTPSAIQLTILAQRRCTTRLLRMKGWLTLTEADDFADADQMYKLVLFPTIGGGTFAVNSILNDRKPVYSGLSGSHAFDVATATQVIVGVEQIKLVIDEDWRDLTDKSAAAKGTAIRTSPDRQTQQGTDRGWELHMVGNSANPLMQGELLIEGEYVWDDFPRPKASPANKHWATKAMQVSS